MSSATKRKHVTRDVVQNFTLPQDDETIVQVRADFVIPATIRIGFVRSWIIKWKIYFIVNFFGFMQWTFPTFCSSTYKRFIRLTLKSVR